MLMELDIFSGGNEYISASRAAQKSGYASDYIGQLCRAQKIPGRLIGRTWYVDFPALIEHKKTRQLGRVKKSRFFPSPKLPKEVKVLKIGALPHNLKNVAFSYEADDRPNLPAISKPVISEFSSDMKLVRKVAALALSLVIIVGAGTLVSRGRAPSLALSQASSTSLFASVSDSIDSLVSGFRNLKDLALSQIEPKNLVETNMKFPSNNPLPDGEGGIIIIEPEMVETAATESADGTQGE